MPQQQFTILFPSLFADFFILIAILFSNPFSGQICLCHQISRKRAYRTLEADRRQVKRNQEMLAMGKSEKDRKWSVGLSAGNTPYSSSRSFGGMSRLNSRSLYATPINMGAVSESDEQTAYSQVLLNNRDRSSTTDVKHKMPEFTSLSSSTCNNLFIFAQK